MDVFAIARGQYGNIGDIMLRRQLLDWVRPLGRLHVYVGSSPPGYDAGLRLAADDVVHRSFADWYGSALAAAARGGTAYVFKPGEIQLTVVGMKEHLAMLPLLLALRARGGRAVRAGVGTRNYAPLPRALMRPSIALSDLTLWRDHGTGDYMRSGAVMPDLAFGEGPDDGAVRSFASATDRDVLVVSMRGDDPDRPYPSTAWIDAVTGFAAAAGLRIHVVTQVRADDHRTARLAGDLGGEPLLWADGTGHDVQERRLRDLYSRAQLVLSDRLHVVIAAFTEGAVPVGSPFGGSDKIPRHFRTIGIEDMSVDAGTDDAAALVDRLTALAARRSEMFACLLRARGSLRRHRDEVRRVLTGNHGAATAAGPSRAA